MQGINAETLTTLGMPKPVYLADIQAFLVFYLLFLFIGTLGASTEQTRVFAFNIAPFFVFFITKNGSEAYFRFKKAYLKSQKGSFELQKSLT